MLACDPAITDDQVDGVHERGLENNGKQLNSFRLNSFRLNGAWLGANDEDQIKLVKAQFIDGPTIVHGWLVGSELNVLTEYGEQVSGSQLAGAVLAFDVIEDGVLTQGRLAKVVSAKPLADAPDVWLYNIAVQNEDESWQPLCVDKDNVATEAILLPDIWDAQTGARVEPRPSGAVTLACRGAALAKCAEWGYAPWRTHDGVSLQDTHQACTRAVRADYCGDGTPHTENGVKIHVKDPLGIQKEDLGQAHVVEAEWTPDGALCLNPDNTRLPDQFIECDLPKCGAAYLDKGLLQTGTPVEP